MTATILIQTVDKDAEFVSREGYMRDFFDGRAETLNVPVMVKALVVWPYCFDQRWELLEQLT